MKVLVDAQLPRKMAGWFGGAGSDALHTLDLSDGNRSTDEQVIERAELDGRVVVSKDTVGAQRRDDDSDLQTCPESRRQGCPKPSRQAVSGLAAASAPC